MNVTAGLADYVASPSEAAMERFNSARRTMLLTWQNLIECYHDHPDLREEIVSTTNAMRQLLELCRSDECGGGL